LATKLKGLRVDEGSLVDKGANEEAIVVLFKRHEDELHEDDAKPKKKKTDEDEDNEGLLEKFLGYFKNLTSTSEENSVEKLEDTELKDDIEKIDAKLLVDIGNIVGTDDEAKLSSIRVALEDYFERLTGKPVPTKKTDGKPFSGATKPFGSEDEDDDDDEEEVKGKKPKKKTRTRKGSDSMSITDEVREDLDDNVQEYLTELEKRADDSDKVEELEAKVAELEKSAEETGKEKVDIWKGVSSEVKTQFEDLQKKAETAEKVAKAEREMRISKEFEEKAAQFPKIGSVEDVSGMLRQAYDVDQESGEKLEQAFKAASEKLETNDHLTKELGQSGDVASGGDAWNKIETMADKLVEKDDEMTQEQAVNKILKTKEGKKLYDEYQTERSVN